jgi:hypothetical protein
VATYRFGQLTFTVEEIRNVAAGHGRDGIVYYPPQDWGGPSHKRDSISLEPFMPLEAVYLAGYRDGYYQRHPRTATACGASVTGKS